MAVDPYIKIPRSIANREDMTSTEKMVYCLLVGLCSNEHQCCAASNDYLAEWIGVGRRHITRIVADLQVKSLIRVEDPKSWGRKIYVTGEHDLRADSPIESALLDKLTIPCNALVKAGLLRIETQVPVGRYRADIVVTTLTNPEQTLVVECDGHQYHEKSRDQAAKDKVRDRFLQSMGYTVFHFTGAEIHYGVDKVVSEIMDWVNRNVKLVPVTGYSQTGF